jgi:hypothetical protein
MVSFAPPEFPGRCLSRGRLASSIVLDDGDRTFRCGDRIIDEMQSSITDRNRRGPEAARCVQRERDWFGFGGFVSSNTLAQTWAKSRA